MAEPGSSAGLSGVEDAGAKVDWLEKQLVVVIGKLKDLMNKKEELSVKGAKLNGLLRAKTFSVAELQEIIPLEPLDDEKWEEEDCTEPFTRIKKKFRELKAELEAELKADEPKLEKDKDDLTKLLSKAQDVQLKAQDVQLKAQDVQLKAQDLLLEEKKLLLEKEQARQGKRPLEHTGTQDIGQAVEFATLRQEVNDLLDDRKRRKIGEWSELDTMGSLEEYNTHDTTGGVLNDYDLKVAHYAMAGRFRLEWNPPVGDLAEVTLRPEQKHGFTDFMSLFEDDAQDLHVVDIQHSQQWSLSGSAAFVDEYQMKRKCNWSSARPDFLVLPGSFSSINSKTASPDVLRSPAPIIFVEVQSDQKKDKYGMTHLRMALMGAYKQYRRAYYGLFVSKGTQYLGEAQLHLMDADGLIHIDSEYSIARVPALCRWVFNQAQ